ncbi:MAG: AAA family ATPase [Magnetococcales bacterium]|nr:AAA family ATPase [Magnetococcales bacterium]
MYHENFGLSQPPFRNTPDTRVFYPGCKRGAILEALEYAVLQGEGIVKVVGEVGSGKTMLCRMLESRLSGKIETVFIANPSLTPENIFHAIAVELRIELGDKTDKFQILQSLQSYLLKKHASGRHVVVLVEEAQGMPLATLEEIRLLSNLETTRSKLLQLILFGQPELDINLSVPSIRQLKERISYQFYLPPFSPEDVEEYLMMRMRSAGYRGPTPFYPRACRRIWKLSGGLTRRINLLADKALLAAYIDKKDRVTARHVNQAASESTFTTVRDWRRTTRLATLVALLGVPIAGGVGFFLADLIRQHTQLYVTTTQPTSQGEIAAEQRSLSAMDEVTQVALQPQSVQQHPSVIPPVKQPEIEPARDGIMILPVAASTDASPPPPTNPKPDPASVPNTDANAVAPSVPAPQPPRGDSAVPTLSPEPPQQVLSVTNPPLPNVKPRHATRIEAGGPSSAPQAAVTTETSTERKIYPLSKEERSQFMDQKLADTDQWLKTANPEHYTLQLMLIANSLDNWLQDMIIAESDLGGKFYVKPLMINNKPHYTVYFSDYSSYAKARWDIERLPPRLRQFKPYVQPIKLILSSTK